MPETAAVAKSVTNKSADMKNGIWDLFNHWAINRHVQHGAVHQRIRFKSIKISCLPTSASS